MAKRRVKCVLLEGEEGRLPVSTEKKEGKMSDARHDGENLHDPR